MKLHGVISAFIKKINIKKLVLYGIIFMMTLAAAFILFKMKVEDTIVPYETYVANNDEEQFIRNLTSGMTIEQSFIAPHDFECITLSCSDHEQSLPGKILLEVWDTEAGESVYSKKIENTDIHYGTPLEIVFPGTGNHSYLVKVTAMDTGEEAIGFYGYLPEEGEQTALVNGEKSDYALSIGIHIYSDLFSRLLYLILIIAFAGFFILLLFLSEGKLKTEQIFLMIAIPMGIALLCFQSVNFIHDGDAHFLQSYHYANELLGKAQNDTRISIGMRQDDVDAVFNCNSAINDNARNMSHIMENWSWFAKDVTMVGGIKWEGVAGANMLEYFPSAIAIALARLFHLGTYPMILLAKLFPFVFYLTACYYAIKIIPVGKRILLFLAALPMSLQQAAGITYDNFTYMVLFLMLALVLKIYYDGINRKTGISLALLCMALSLCKGGVYTPMLFLLLCIPKKKMGNIKKKIIYILVTGSLTLLLFLVSYRGLLKVYLNPAPPVTEQTTEVMEEKEENTVVSETEQEPELVYVMDQRYGMSFCLKQPTDFAKLVMQTVVDKTEEYYRGILGRIIAWPAADVPAWSSFLFGIILLLSINRVGTEEKIDCRLKLGMLVTFALVAMAHFVIFSSETTKGMAYIWGIQGRYFIPLLLLLLLCIRNNHATEEEGAQQGLYILYDVQWIFYLMGYYIGKGF